MHFHGPVWGITESFYNRKREEYRAKQRDISDQISRLGFADEEYYVTSEYLLQLANRAYDLFLSSKAEGKRQLLKLTLQNLRIEGNSVKFELAKPFDKVFACTTRQTWLPLFFFKLTHYSALPNHLNCGISRIKKKILSRKRPMKSKEKSSRAYLSLTNSRTPSVKKTPMGRIAGKR